MRLDVAFWLLNSDGSYRCPLPDHGKWTLSPIAGAPGAVTLDYPVTGQNFAALREHHDADRDAQVAIWIDGRDDGSLRALLVAEAADDIDEAAVWTFTGHFTEVRMEESVIRPRTEVVVPPQGEAPTEDLAAFRIYSATAGTIMGTLMQEAHTYGELADIGTSTFTGTTDSNGAAWAEVITLKFAPGVDLLKVLGSLDEYQLCEWAVVDGELELYEPGSRGTDRTLGPDPVILRRGRDMTDSPRKRTIRGAPTDLVVAGAEGLYIRVTDETARARRGRVITAYASAGSLNDEGSLLAYGQTKLAQLVNGTMEVTHGLSLGDEGPVPLLDYGVSDWLFSDTGRPELERLQVAQITVSGDETGEITASVSLNDLIASRQAELARRISGIEGGSTITGTSQARPVQEGPDTTTPAAPQGLVAQTSAYLLSTGEPKARITAQWGEVLTNTDQTAIEDLAGYRVRYRYKNSAPESWTAAPDVTGTTTTFASVTVGELIGVQVAAYDQSGHFSEWSDEVLIVAADDTTPPPAPSAPVVTPYLGVLLVEIDGLGAQGEPMPADTDTFLIFTSTDAVFSGATLFDRLVGSRTTVYTEGTYGVEQYFWVVAVDRSGNESDPSAAGSAVPVQAADGDLAGLNVGKLIAGELTAVILFVTGMLRSGAAGRRWELDADGLRFYDADDNVVINLDQPTASAVLTGTVQTGATGRRAMLSGEDNSLRFYPSNDETRWAVVEGFIPVNYPDSIALQMTSSRSSFLDHVGYVQAASNQANLTVSQPGTASAAFASVQVFRDSLVAGLGPGLFREEGDPPEFRGGRLTLNRYNGSSTQFQAELSAYNYGEWRSYVAARDDGVMVANVNGGAYFHVKRDGYIIMNGYELMTPSGVSSYVKSFVIDHPADPDRWLVHGCTESPTAAVEYTGEAVVDGIVQVGLPDYFEGLVEEVDRTVQLTVMDDALGPRIPAVAASPVRHGRFTIRCDHPDPVRVAWHVRGTRRDASFEVEPRRSDYTAHGDGPYRYLVPREA